MAKATIAARVRPECDGDHGRIGTGNASDMWVNDGRIGEMETRIAKLEENVHTFPQQIEAAVCRALEAHEKREKEWIAAVSEKITGNIFEGLLGEDLATGPDAAKNRRAMQQMIRQGVSMASFMMRMQSRVIMTVCVAIFGALVLLFVSSGAIVEFVKLKMKVWMGL